MLAYDPTAVLRVTPKLVDISNLTPNNAIWAADDRLRRLSQANQLWHTDSSFKRLPARMLMLYAHTVVPLGSHTEYAGMRAAYDELFAGAVWPRTSVKCWDWKLRQQQLCSTS